MINKIHIYSFNVDTDRCYIYDLTFWPFMEERKVYKDVKDVAMH